MNAEQMREQMVDAALVLVEEREFSEAWVSAFKILEENIPERKVVKTFKEEILAQEVRRLREELSKFKPTD